MVIARVEAAKYGGIPRSELEMEEEGKKEKPDRIGPGTGRPLDLSQAVKAWAGVDFVGSNLYLVVAIISLQRDDSLIATIGWSGMVDSLLYSGGSFLAWKRRFSGARACWIIAGICGLPLATVMLTGARQLQEVPLELNLGSKFRYLEVGVPDQPDHHAILNNTLPDRRVNFFLEAIPTDCLLAAWDPVDCVGTEGGRGRITDRGVRHRLFGTVVGRFVRPIRRKEHLREAT